MKTTKKNKKKMKTTYKNKNEDDLKKNDTGRRPHFYLNGRRPIKNAILNNSAAQATQQPKIDWHNQKNQP